MRTIRFVVICFKILIFVTIDTTNRIRFDGIGGCDLL